MAEKKGWRKISRNERAPSFRGDVVLDNGLVALAIRKGSRQVELYSHGTAGAPPRVRLELLDTGGVPAARLERVELAENSRSAKRLEARYRTKTGAPLAAQFRLKRGGTHLQVEPGPGAGRLRVDCPGRFAVLPDFFADDILIDAGQIPLSALDLPSENILLHLTGGGDSIAQCVFEDRRQEVRILLSERDGERLITGSEIQFGGRRVWVALLEEKGIWHAFRVRPGEAGKIRDLPWRMPFPAQWRIDFTVNLAAIDGLTDSWEMLLPAREGGGFQKPSWLDRWAIPVPPTRRRWTTVLGWFLYPCWIDREGRGHIQPLKHREIAFRGPAVIYPINRMADTPIAVYTVVDVTRNCLGAGPCEYILKVESQKQELVGRATCAVRDALNKIYGSGRQRQKRAEIEAALDDGLAFVTHIRGRITRYVEFGGRIRKYLAEQRMGHPELEESISELEEIARQFDVRYSRRREKIKTPDHVAGLNRTFREQLLEYEGSDAMERLKKYTDALTRIGGNQDELVGECRWVARSLRQRAGILMARDPRFSGVAEEIRARTRDVLLNPATYEGMRH